MSCTNCLPSNPCNHHNSCNSCGQVKKKSPCDNCPQIDWVPGTAATIGVTVDGCTDTLDLTSGIRNAESKTHFSQNPITGCLEYQNEQYVASQGTMGYIETVCPADIAKFINLDDLADVNAPNPENCSILVRNPECGNDPCPNPCENPYQWKAYKIPYDEGCMVEPDENGMYRVLTTDDCGCPVLCNLAVGGPVVADYHRDSVPDDPDWPWYYGQYNETIDLHLADNSPFFGKTDLEVTVYYGVQAIKPRTMHNYNWRSMIVPTIKGENIPVTTDACILQDDCSAIHSASLVADSPYHDADRIPWGSKSLRGAFTCLVPKGKDLTLHHEFRVRTYASEQPGTAGYCPNPEYDGKRVPDDLVSAVDQLPWGASRLNALQVITRPAVATKHLTPVLDIAKDQLDPAVDVYPPLIIP